VEFEILEFAQVLQFFAFSCTIVVQFGDVFDFPFFAEIKEKRIRK